jgi:hypothetical protein
MRTTALFLVAKNTIADFLKLDTEDLVKSIDFPWRNMNPLSIMD